MSFTGKHILFVYSFKLYEFHLENTYCLFILSNYMTICLVSEQQHAFEILIFFL